MVVEGVEVRNFWSGVPDLQEWMVRVVLNEINLAIHAWSNSTAGYGQRVHDSGRILRLFGNRDVGETRDARRDPRSDLGRRGASRLGAGWTDCSAFFIGVYFFPFPFPFSFFIINSNEHFGSGEN
jgi:hypothetical protein